MSATVPPYEVGQKVHLIAMSGQVSSKRFEIVRVWRYPTTYRYLLDTGYVADHAELRASEGADAAVAKPSSAADADDA